MKGAGRAWVIAGVAIAAWAVLGHFFDTSSRLGWLPAVALGAATLAPLAFVLLYTALGLLGGAKWWLSDLGTNLVWLEVAAFTGRAFIFWAVLFNHGNLDEPWQAWAYLGCQFAAAAIITWRSVIWLRLYRRDPPLLARIRELEADNAALRDRLGEGSLYIPGCTKAPLRGALASLASADARLPLALDICRYPRP